MERRTDQVTAMLLNTALNAAKKYGTSPPAAELQRLGISGPTVERVLTKPDERRQFLKLKSDVGMLL